MSKDGVILTPEMFDRMREQMHNLRDVADIITDTDGIPKRRQPCDRCLHTRLCREVVTTTPESTKREYWCDECCERPVSP